MIFNSIIIPFIASLGIFIFGISLINAINNRLSYNKPYAEIISGLLYGLYTYLFVYTSMYIGGNKIVDFRFLMVIYVLYMFDSRVFLFMIPTYLLGVFISGASPIVHISVIIIGYFINILKLNSITRIILLIGSIISIIFTEPLLSQGIERYNGKTIVTLGTFFAIVVICVIYILYNFYKNGNMGMGEVCIYAGELMSRFKGIYHFKIDFKNEYILLPRKFYYDFEVANINGNKMNLDEFFTLFSNSLSESKDIVSTINQTGNNRFTYLTPKSLRVKHINVLCKKAFSGAKKGYIHDITSTLSSDEIIYRIIQRNYITGLNSYYVMKGELAELAKQHSGLMLLMHVELSQSNKNESIFGLEFQNNSIKSAAEMLKNEFIDGHIYSIKDKEFQIAIFNLNSDSDAKNHVRRVMNLFSKPIQVGEKTTRYTATIGVLVCESLKYASIEGINELITKVMWTHANSTKLIGSVHYFNNKQYSQALNQLKRAEAILNLIIDGDFYPVFQPIISVKTAQVAAYEVLIRVKNEIYKSTKQLILDSFSLNLDTELDIAIIKCIYRNVVERGLNANLFINKLSKTPIIDEINDLGNYLQSKGNKLSIELTEYEHYELSDIKYTCSQLRAKDINVVIDDYGAAYSSPILLSEVVPNVVKIDIDLINEINNNQNKEYMVKSIIGFCKNLNISILAEGVSNKEDFVKLISLGVDYIQGFYVGKPDLELCDVSQDIKDEIISISSLSKQANI